LNVGIITLAVNCEVGEKVTGNDTALIGQTASRALSPIAAPPAELAIIAKHGIF
jgi:hypothetical protein